MAYTEAQLESFIAKLEAALAIGARQVQIGDRVTTFNSADEIQARIQYFQDQLAGVSGTRRPRQFVVVPRSGL